MTSISRRHDPTTRDFVSDDCAGVHPDILAALAAANGGHLASCGDDVYTERLGEVFRAHFGEPVSVWPVINGIGANVVALQSMSRCWEAVIAGRPAHVDMVTRGDSGWVGGMELLTVTTSDGKLTPELIDTCVWARRGRHHAQPRVIAIAQSTELGTCYTPEEVRAVCDHAHESGMTVFMDGARICNAAASLGVPLREFTTDVGVDVVTFGGTRNGLLFGECVVVLNPDAVRGLRYLRESAMQLASKMRFVSAQFEALLGSDLWLRNAAHSNAMAKRLEAAVANIDGVEVVRPVQANAVFAIIPPEAATRLRSRYRFDTWDEHAGEVRWMTSFDTTDGDVEAFAAALADEMRATEKL